MVIVDPMIRLLTCASSLQQLHKVARGEPVMLRVTVEGGGCSGFQYKFSLDSNMGDDDRLVSLPARDWICYINYIQTAVYIMSALPRGKGRQYHPQKKLCAYIQGTWSVYSSHTHVHKQGCIESVG